MEIFTAAGLAALLQVIVIDLVLAGDNAVVIGLAAAGLTLEQEDPAGRSPRDVRGAMDQPLEDGPRLVVDRLDVERLDRPHATADTARSQGHHGIGDRTWS